MTAGSPIVRGSKPWMNDGVSYPAVPDVPIEPAIERLFWRAGFGPSADDRRRWKQRGLGAATEAARVLPGFNGQALRVIA
jgi:hypothetical protein